MILLIASIILLAVGIIITIRKPISDWLEMIGGLSVLFGVIITISLIMAFTISYYECKAEMIAFEETRLTYERATADGTNIYAAFKVAESNRWLRKQQYWNETILDIAIPDEIKQLEVIK